MDRATRSRRAQFPQTLYLLPLECRIHTERLWRFHFVRLKLVDVGAFLFSCYRTSISLDLLACLLFEFNVDSEQRMRKEQPDRLELLQGTLEMMILRTLLFGPTNGYQIAKVIERMSDDVLQVDHSSLYPALHRLEKKGWLISKWEDSETGRRAKSYRLTRLGRKQLLAEQSKWDRLTRAIGRVMRPA